MSNLVGDFGVIIVILIFQLILTVVSVILVLMINQKKMIKTTLQALGKEGTPLLNADPNESQRANESIMAGLQSIEQKLQQQEIQLQQLNYIKENLGNAQALNNSSQIDLKPEKQPELITKMEEPFENNNIAPVAPDEIATNELEQMLDEDVAIQPEKIDNFKVIDSTPIDENELINGKKVRELIPRNRNNNNNSQSGKGLSTFGAKNEESVQTVETIETVDTQEPVETIDLESMNDMTDNIQDISSTEDTNSMLNIEEISDSIQDSVESVSEPESNIDFGVTEDIQQLESDSEIKLEDETELIPETDIGEINISGTVEPNETVEDVQPIVEETKVEDIDDNSSIKPQKNEIRILDDDEMDAIGNMSPEERMARIMDEKRKEVVQEPETINTTPIVSEPNIKEEVKEENIIPESEVKIEESKIVEEHIEDVKEEAKEDIIVPEAEIKVEENEIKEEKEDSEKQKSKNMLEEKVKEAKNVLKAKELQKTNENAKIVIVDDTRIMRTILKKMLSEKGYKNVIDVENGNKAIEFCNNNKDIDLMIIDAEMPGIDGVGTMKEILNNKKEQKIIITSSIADEDRIDSFKEQGAIGFINKPFDQNMVLKSVEEALKNN